MLGVYPSGGQYPRHTTKASATVVLACNNNQASVVLLPMLELRLLRGLQHVTVLKKSLSCE
jgi:hypothetical protein